MLILSLFNAGVYPYTATIKYVIISALKVAALVIITQVTPGLSLPLSNVSLFLAPRLLQFA